MKLLEFSYGVSICTFYVVDLTLVRFSIRNETFDLQIREDCEVEER